MEIHLNRLEAGPLELDFSFETERIEGAQMHGPLACRVRLEAHREQIKLTGHYQAELTLPCDVCTAPARIKQEGNLDLILVPASLVEDLPEDVELSVDSPDMDYYSGNAINLDPYFEDQLMLDLPFRVLCKEDCLGMCGRCGADLNQGPCGCSEINENSPFAILKDWKPSKDT
ncbi:MAG: DUF177 domain-containing protein [bacterium]|nr:DUF177 domain-containing protein [bacterium]